jgi:hypothetical protein
MHTSVLAAAAAERTRELRDQAQRDRERATVRRYARTRRSGR